MIGMKHNELSITKCETFKTIMNGDFSSALQAENDMQNIILFYQWFGKEKIVPA